MARRIPLEPLIALFAAAVVSLPTPAGDEADPTVLVSYSFEDELATGPDTLSVFERSKGRVSLSRALRSSGYRSVEIRDVAADGNFPELAGPFALRERGRVHAHFALLVTDPAETLNLALAGPAGFTLAPDGIAFWMLSREGFLHHYSDSMPKKLFALRAFVWYTVDLTYDVGRGTYDLTVREEGRDEPAVALVAQPNAAARAGSSIDKFSFIGDTGDDRSNVVYYVDDVIVSVDEPVEQAPFVAPGRRKLFVDAWVELQARASKTPSCVPAVDLADFGVDPARASELAREGLLDAFEALLAGATSLPSLSIEQASDESRRLLEGALARNRGCEALERGDVEAALALFDEAAAHVPEALIHDLSAALALARGGRAAEADARLATVERGLRNDPRFAQAAAMIGLARGDLDLESAALAEQHFFVLLWQGDLDGARRFARARGESGLWLERSADASFLLGDVGTAHREYTRALEESPNSALLMTKLADACFLLDDVEGERELREAVYGRLSE